MLTVQFFSWNKSARMQVALTFFDLVGCRRMLTQTGEKFCIYTLGQSYVQTL
jgi:hypothetical protein